MVIIIINTEGVDEGTDTTTIDWQIFITYQCTGIYKGNKQMDQWCSINCAKDNAKKSCPEAWCKCEQVFKEPESSTVPTTKTTAKSKNKVTSKKPSNIRKPLPQNKNKLVLQQEIPNSNENTAEWLTFNAKKCVAAGNYRGSFEMNEWCRINCNKGYCPSTHCDCGQRSSTDSDNVIDSEDQDESQQPTISAIKGNGMCQ